MNTEDWRAFLSEHPVFSCLSGEQLARLLSAEASGERTCSQDDVVLQEGAAGDSIFLIAKGEVSVVLPGAAGRPVPISTLGEGEFFGEMALIEKKPRSATVIAREEAVLLEIKGPAFYRLLRENAEFEFKVLLVLSERLRHLVEHTLSVQLKDLDERLELLNRRLDADLKVVAAELKASQAVFDQTNTRANEIIVSADRSRTRLTAFISAVGGVVGVFIVVAGLFGFKEVMDIRGAATDIRKDAKSAKADLKEIQKARDTLDSVVKDASLFSEFKVLTYSQIILPRFSEEMTKDLGEASKSYEELLGVGEQTVTDELFKSISDGLTTLVGDLELTRNRRADYRQILKEGIQEGYVKTERQKILSYYLLLVALAFDNKRVEYNTTVTEFADYIQSDYGDEPIKDELEEDFGPEYYEWLIEDESSAIFGKKDSDSEAGEAGENEEAVSRTLETQARMIKWIKEAWDKIP